MQLELVNGVSPILDDRVGELVLQLLIMETFLHLLVIIPDRTLPKEHFGLTIELVHHILEVLFAEQGFPI